MAVSVVDICNGGKFKIFKIYGEIRFEIGDVYTYPAAFPFTCETTLVFSAALMRDKISRDLRLKGVKHSIRGNLVISFAGDLFK